MRQKKKILFSIFISLIFLFLSGFSFFNRSEDKQKVEIEFFNQKSEIAEGLRHAGKSFEKEHPNVMPTDYN